MIKVLKASAGSGKTYALAKEYIRLLLTSKEPSAYRHILAVTFTNKSTDEMKRRILKELYTLSTKPSASPYHADFVPVLLPDDAALRKRASEQLNAILHDYSAFSVSTIDKFFQQTLRAFSREIGQFAFYQVDLDKEALIQESVDSVLDALTEEDTVML
ncbi:MAG: UvrD-helicase domain-containing protein, partial [Bacteroidales bacterium]|nr:UvrD-helicase domain-containing protein [Bacteroidales bacterium]